MAGPDDEFRPYPLFRGATRVPLWFGVPVVPMVFAFAIVMSGFMLWHRPLIGLVVMIPIALIMRAIVKYDDRAFRIWGLWFETKARNFRLRKFWQASSYSPVSYKPDYRQSILDRLRSRSGR